jgi:hypothetical protein
VGVSEVDGSWGCAQVWRHACAVPVLWSLEARTKSSERVDDFRVGSGGGAQRSLLLYGARPTTPVRARGAFVAEVLAEALVANCPDDASKRLKREIAEKADGSLSPTTWRHIACSNARLLLDLPLRDGTQRFSVCYYGNKATLQDAHLTRLSGIYRGYQVMPGPARPSPAQPSLWMQVSWLLPREIA